MSWRCLLTIIGLIVGGLVQAEGLSAERLGVLYKQGDPGSRQIALFYAARRAIPSANIIGVDLPDSNSIAPAAFAAVRATALDRLPTSVQSLALIWSKPYAVGCMSITTAFAAGYRAAFCEPACSRTAPNPLFDSDGWLPADTVGWWPAMMVPSDNIDLARALIQRGVAADASMPTGTAYLVTTQDSARNVRAATYADVKSMPAIGLKIELLATPLTHDIPDAIAYFTGAAHVDELGRIHFRPGAVADHLTSTGGVLFGGRQMSALAWLSQGATGSYGSVSEPCNHLGKFPSVGVFLERYSHGETLLEAYWKSVAMPGQGLFIGEPLARPYATRRR